MTDHHSADDLVVQRFADNELTPEERIAFLARLGRDDRLRQRTMALERLSMSAARLPRPVVPEGFVSNVLRHTHPERTGLVSRLLQPLWTPWPIQLNFAGAAAACVALLVAGASVGLALRPSTETGSRPASDPATAATAAAVSGAASERVLVRLVVVQPGATTVQAAGDFNGWDPSRTPLEPVANGAWTATIPLQPGRYEYMFVVDGREWVVDPFAVEHSDDGFGSRNAVLEVQPVREAEGSPL